MFIYRDDYYNHDSPDKGISEIIIAKPVSYTHLLAVLCALYCVGSGLFVGFGSYFFLIWGAIAAFCAAWGWILTHKSVQERIPRWIRMTFCGLVAAGILLLLI